MTAPVVTISAPYGTGGPVIGSAVAEQLGVSFLDRAIPHSVARALAVPETDALAHDERAETRIGRLLSALATSGMSFNPMPDVGIIPTEGAYREQTERVIREAAQSDGCVVLGRGAVIVLSDHPTALHVCLSGSLDRRVHQVATFGQDDEASARRLVEDTDRTRAAYFRHFYRTEPDDPHLYHLVIDSTLLDSDTCIALIVTAARARISGDRP
jgi:cytidylate kinase